MAAGATAAFAVPTGWIGNVAINNAGQEITGDDTLIEANFVVPDSGGYKMAVADVDVSYVYVNLLSEAHPPPRVV